MSSAKSLEVYLTDHMAGSVSASDLAKRGARNNEGQLSRFFADLAREIDIDRRTLKSVGDRVGAQPNPLKQMAGVIAERISRFKIDHRMTGSQQLSLLLELELLYLGIEGKHTLWRTLRQIAGSDQRLAGFDFDKLAKRAESQLESVEAQRLAVATEALPA